MKTIVVTRAKKITVQFVEHAIRITNDDELLSLLATDTEAATEELITKIAEQYYSIFHTRFAVSEASLAVEIWGHVYVDKFADVVKTISPFNLIDKLADKVMHFCDVIDIGEVGHDNNRFVWDGLAPFKSVIAHLLPAKRVVSSNP